MGNIRTLVVHSNLILGTRRKNLQFLDTHTIIHLPLLKTENLFERNGRKIWRRGKSEQRTAIHVHGPFHNKYMNYMIVNEWKFHCYFHIFIIVFSNLFRSKVGIWHWLYNTQHSILLNLKLLLRIIIYINYVSHSKNGTNIHYKHLCSFIVECNVWRSIGMWNEHLDAHFEFWKLQQKWNETNKIERKKNITELFQMKLYM